jgi:hypothetical protein
MKKKIFLTTVLSLILTTASSLSVFAFNSDNPANAGKYYAFNQFYVDHFTGCANGDVDYLSHYNAITIPLESGSAMDRMKYIADNEWIPIAGYSPSKNVMSMYFCGEQNLDYTNQAIQIDPNYANDSLSDSIKGLSKSDVKALRNMTKAADTFNYYLDYLPEKASNQAFEVSSVYEDFDNFIRLFDSKQMNVTVGTGATLKLDGAVKIDELSLSGGATLDLSAIKAKDLRKFNSLNKISSDGGIFIFPADATDKQQANFLTKVNGTYTIGAAQ